MEHRIGGVELGETGFVQIDVERNCGIVEREGRMTCGGYVCHVAFFQEFLSAWRPVPLECASEDFAVSCALHVCGGRSRDK